MPGKSELISKADWAKMDGLLPAVIQDSKTMQILMLGYMNKESLAHTLETGDVTFYSRSKQRLWTKGETSGNKLKLVDITLDCDQDSFLVQAVPQGPTCHLGNDSCFADSVAPEAVLLKLGATIEDRKNNPAESSYTHSLLTGPLDRLCQKVGEEGVEVALAGMKGDKAELAEEAADLTYHLLTLLSRFGMNLTDLTKVLAKRANIS